MYPKIVEIGKTKVNRSKRLYGEKRYKQHVARFYTCVQNMGEMGPQIKELGFRADRPFNRYESSVNKNLKFRKISKPYHTMISLP